MTVAVGDRSSREARIRAALVALHPLRVDLTDDSHRHVGHAGARDGRGHFTLEIVSAAFSGELPLARHRRVFSALGRLMDTDIHALSLKALTPREAGLD